MRFITCVVLASLLFLLADRFVLAGGLLLLSALGATVVVTKAVGSWFGFLLFLIYITGLLVLFGYMVAISENRYVAPKHFKFAPLALAGVWAAPMAAERHRGDRAWPAQITQVFYGNLQVYWFSGVVLFLALLIAVSLCYKSPKPLRSFVACKQSFEEAMVL